MLQLDIFYEIQERLKKDKSVTGIMLMGSVAQNTALPESDLDIMVLSNENLFKTEIIDNILVEYTFTTYENRLQKLLSNEMEVYRFLNSKITYDIANKLAELKNIAVDKYSNFKASQETKNQISHWLLSVKIKLLATINSHDILKQNFLVATNSWKIIEAVWAVNNKPVPPTSSVMKFKNELSAFPYPDWFEKLFYGSEKSRTEAMIEIIDWILPILDI